MLNCQLPESGEGVYLHPGLFQRPGELNTNFEGKLEAAWAKLQQYDFVCLHLEAPDECTHNGDLPV